uniref:Mitochondrial import inner membrane translocase subunit TIM50 n=1 Tax=Musa acuminata TaxID=4641 RepID=Q1EP88_MUSAC|nr:hypothetical protein MA4_64C22.26 [Musa acuminata]
MLLSFVPICDLFATLLDVALIHFLLLQFFLGIVPVKALELYLDLRRAIEDHVRGFTEPSSEKLLPDLHPQEQHVFTLVLDLNETLVYSDWKVSIPSGMLVSYQSDVIETGSIFKSLYEIAHVYTLVDHVH